MDQVKIGSFLKKLRNERELTQKRLAEKFNVSSRTVSRWETGSNMPDLALLVELAEFYDVDIREIINGERKSESMNTEEKETLQLAAEYAEEEKKILLKRVRLISIIGAITMIVFSIMWLMDNGAVLPVYNYVRGVCFGISFGAILCSIFYTTGVLAWVRQRKNRHIVKGLAVAVIIICIVILVAAFVQSIN